MSAGTHARTLIDKYLRSSPPAKSEEDCFLQCPVCGQTIDCRDLPQIFHHAQREHDRLPDH